MKTYTVHASRTVAVRYLACELGSKAAKSIAAANGAMPCASIFGAAQSSLTQHLMTAVFRRKKDAEKFRHRVDVLAAETAGRLRKPAAVCY